MVPTELKSWFTNTFRKKGLEVIISTHLQPAQPSTHPILKDLRPPWKSHHIWQSLLSKGTGRCSFRTVDGNSANDSGAAPVGFTSRNCCQLCRAPVDTPPPEKQRGPTVAGLSKEAVTPPSSGTCQARTDDATAPSCSDSLATPNASHISVHSGRWQG